MKKQTELIFFPCELTKEQKLKFIDFAIKDLNRRKNLKLPQKGFCGLICDFILIYGLKNTFDIKLNFPELHEYKPKELQKVSYWFDKNDFQKRINILIELKNKLEK